MHSRDEKHPNPIETMVLSRKTQPDPCSSESGFSLAEVLAAMMIFAVLLGATVTFLNTAEITSSKDTETANATQEAQTGLDRMVRDLRQASSVVIADPNTLDVTVGDKEIRYQCGVADPTDSRYRRCVRSAGAVGAVPPGTGGEVVVARLLNGTAERPVFTYTYPPAAETDADDEAADPADPDPAPQPTYVTMALAVPAAGERKGGYKHEVVLDTGFYLRNVDYAGNGL